MPIEDLVHPLLGLYTAAPQWVKSSLGQLYAQLPAAVRHGPMVRQFAADIALGADPVRLQAHASAKLQATLAWAIATVPAYAHLAPLRARELTPEQLLAAFPLLSKHAIKADSARYLSQQMGTRTHLLAYTGGSTSVPMKLYLEKFVSRAKDFAYNGAFDALAGTRRWPGSGRPCR